MAFGIRIPALADGLGNAANGSALTNLGGKVSNHAGCKFIQADDSLKTRGDGFWINTSDFVERSHTEWLARTNGADDQLDQGETLGSGGEMHITASALYTEGTNPAPNAWTKEL